MTGHAQHLQGPRALGGDRSDQSCGTDQTCFTLAAAMTDWDDSMTCRSWPVAAGLQRSTPDWDSTRTCKQWLSSGLVGEQHAREAAVSPHSLRHRPLAAAHSAACGSGRP